MWHAEINDENDVPSCYSSSILHFLHKFLKRYLKLKTLTGRKLVTESLLSVSISKGETHAILALSGNIPLLKLLLIAVAIGLFKTFADNFINFVESYLYLRISYYQYFLKVVLHHKRKPLEGGCFPL